jgi:peptidoglycan/LPS O-acetylase OafA/YrhL
LNSHSYENDLVEGVGHHDRTLRGPQCALNEWRINNFDLVRLLAALQVAVVHAIANFTPHGTVFHVLQHGLSFFPGVPIFFVISGLLISRSYEQSKSILDHYRNRCLRIFPGLWVCLVVSLAVICVSGVGSLGTVSTWDWSLWWAAQMSIFQSYQPHFLSRFGSAGLNGSLWTIPIELEFYLLLPLLYGVLKLHQRRGNVLILAVLVASLAFELIVVHWPSDFAPITSFDFLRLTLAPYLWMFLVGVLIQRNWHAVRGKVMDRVHWWFAGYVLICLLARSLRIGVGGNDINPLFLLPLAGLIISFAMSVRTLSEKVLRRWDISYGLYTYHALVICLMMQLALLSVTGATAISLAIAAVSWILVEKPFLMRKRGSLRAVLTAPVAAGGAI